MSILKVFANGDERKAVLESAQLIEEYDAFLLVQASEATARELAKKFPVEDISDQYALQFGDRTIKTAARRASPAGKNAASKAGAKLHPGPHHYVVQFIGPIKQSWLTQIRRTGAKLRQPCAFQTAPVPDFWIGNLVSRHKPGTDVSALFPLVQCPVPSNRMLFPIRH
jgi:hypothetical protein